MAIHVMLCAAAAAASFIGEVLVGFALIGTNVLACGNAEATMWIALMCDRRNLDSV